MKDAGVAGAELVVRGMEPGQEARLRLVEGVTVRIGRAPANGWVVPWDNRISREHADLLWQGGRLVVTCVTTALNPLLFHGASSRKLTLNAGESFFIGDTRFSLVVPEAVRPVASTVEIHAPAAREASPREMPLRPGGEPMVRLVEGHDTALSEYAYRADDLKRFAFSNPARQMEILANLPRVITDAHGDVELAVLLSGMLLDAIPQAQAVAAVQFEEAEVHRLREAEDPESHRLADPLTVRVRTRENYTGRFVPSRRLLQSALLRCESVLHIWEGKAGGEVASFTISDNIGWAFCVPVAADSCTGWCLYVSGKGSPDGAPLVTEDALKGDLRFTELLAQFIGSVRQVRTLEQRATQLGSFFSPKVIYNLTKRSAADLLTPSERDITVLFCDVRGFSRRSEELQQDLPKLLSCVRAVLAAMTGGILAFDGAIADFQGDAALGFWGWPVPPADGPLPACQAALTIHTVFGLSHDDDTLRGFSVGMGLAHGRGIAGEIGTPQQAKIGVFGPVVNRGARLEGLTRMLGVPICIDEATAAYARRHLTAAEGRCRRLARVRPKGMETAIEVSELLPPEAEAPHVTDETVARHEYALDAVTDGRWAEAAELLRGPPPDGPAAFLLEQMARHGNTPPADWDGAFRLTTK